MRWSFSIFLDPMPHSLQLLLVPNPSSLFISKLSLVFLLSLSTILRLLPLISTLLHPFLFSQWPNYCNLFYHNSSCRPIIFKPHLFATSSLQIFFIIFISLSPCISTFCCHNLSSCLPIFLSMPVNVRGLSTIQHNWPSTALITLVASCL